MDIERIRFSKSLNPRNSIISIFKRGLDLFHQVIHQLLELIQLICEYFIVNLMISLLLKKKKKHKFKRKKYVNNIYLKLFKEIVAWQKITLPRTWVYFCATQAP